MSGVKTPLSGEWKKLFSDATQFNQYSDVNKIEIENAILSDIKMSGVRFSGAIFENTDWESVSLFGATIKDSKFIGGKYRNAAFQKAIVENTVFEGITFVNGDFQGATLKNVSFVNCNFGRANFQYLEDSNIVFKGAVLEEVEFYESKADIQYIDSKLTEIEMMGVQSKERFVVRGSDVYDIDLNSSIIPHLEITDSTIKDAGFSGGKAKSLVMKNLKGAWQASGATIDEVIVENVETDVLLLAGVTAKSIKVSQAKISDSLLGSCECGDFEIANSNIKSIWNGGSRVTTFTIKNTELRGTRNENSRFGTFRLENVTLDGKFNFDYTQAENMELVRVTKGPNFQFRGRDSNIQF